MRKKFAPVLLALGALCVTASITWAAEEENEGDVAKLMPAAKVTLQQGLKASEAEGKPISAKFEAEDGGLQLSVYTAKGGKFYEVVVDHTTGKVAKSEPITEGDDLAHAKSQVAALDKAKGSLQSAVERAEHDNAGARAVSVVPKLSNGHAVATVVLLKGTKYQTVSESLE